MTRLARHLAVWLALLVAACGSLSPPAPPPSPPDGQAQPLLKLSPASLGRELAQQQQLTIQVRGQTHRLDVLLEADAQSVRLAVIAMGQTAARLEWNGTNLTESRAAWWPAGVEGQRILSDLQLMLWPAAAINAALPAGWHLQEAGGNRTLAYGGQAVATVVRRTATLSELESLRPAYRIAVESRDFEAAP